MLPVTGCVPYSWTSVTNHWMAGPDDVIFRFDSHSKSKTSVPIAYGVGESTINSEMYVQHGKGPWQVLFTKAGAVSIPRMGADEDGFLWIRWNERWEKTDIHLTETNRPDTLNQLAGNAGPGQVVTHGRSSMPYLDRGDEDVLPSVTPFGVMNDEDGKRLEWLPDAAGRFTRWIETDHVPLAAVYRPGFVFDRIDRRRGDQLLPDRFLYVWRDNVVGVYWRRVSRRQNGAEYSRQDFNHIVGWIHNNQIVRIDLELPADHYRIRPARRTFTGLSVPLDSLVRSEQLKSEGTWLNANESRLDQLLTQLLK